MVKDKCFNNFDFNHKRRKKTKKNRGIKSMKLTFVCQPGRPVMIQAQEIKGLLHSSVRDV